MKRRTILVAPPGENLARFRNLTVGSDAHREAVEAVQRFRGFVYVAEGNLAPSELYMGERHVQAPDSKSWHLVTLSERNQVEACLRICFYDARVAFRQLTVAHSALATSDVWGLALREAVEDTIDEAASRGVRFAEFGGWAVSSDIRCTTEAVRMVLTGYALGRILGGFLGVSTVNRRHHSASILRRIGARPLADRGSEIPPYYEPAYRSELEILQFDSERTAPQFDDRIEQCAALIDEVQVVAPRRTEVESRPAVRPRTVFPVPAFPACANTARAFSGQLILRSPSELSAGLSHSETVPAHYAELQEYRIIDAACRAAGPRSIRGIAALAGAPALAVLAAALYVFSGVPEGRPAESQIRAAAFAPAENSGVSADHPSGLAPAPVNSLGATAPVVPAAHEDDADNIKRMLRPFEPPPHRAVLPPPVRLEKPPIIMASMSPSRPSFLTVRKLPSLAPPKTGLASRFAKFFSAPFRTHAPKVQTPTGHAVY